MKPLLYLKKNNKKKKINFLIGFAIVGFGLFFNQSAIGQWSTSNNIISTSTDVTIGNNISRVPNLQLRVGNSLGFSSGLSQSEINFNSYMFDGQSNWLKRINAGATFRFLHSNSGFNFQAAPSGAAESSISFTDALTIKPNAHIGIGINDPATRLEIKNTNAPVWAVGMYCYA